MAFKRELTLLATLDNLSSMTSFIEECLEELNCPMKVVMQVNIAIDELFSNVVNYAYKDKIGNMSAIVEKIDGGVSITRIDSGIPYNPLLNEDPDITLGIEERKVGGLGIFIVKKIMDSMTYEYKDKKNIVVVTKKF